jgi:hypothetical protein
MYAMFYYSLYMTFNHLKSFFYYRGNEMKKLGYEFWQISQNVMLLFNQ